MSEAMKKELQEGFEKALASFEKRQEAEHQQFREREKFEIESAGIRTVVVVPALEEIKALLSKAGWQCEVRADKDQGCHFTIYRGNVKGERPYMTFQPEKSKDALVIYVATRGSGSQLGNFTVDQITQDFVQTEALKFFERLTLELSTPSTHDPKPPISRTDDPPQRLSGQMAPWSQLRHSSAPFPSACRASDPRESDGNRRGFASRRQVASASACSGHCGCRAG